jgi:hypothetical protein
MVVENPTWGAPRIHGELLMLGFDVSERTISLDETGASRSGAGETLAYLSPQSPGSDCRNGLLHGSDDHLQHALLLFVISRKQHFPINGRIAADLCTSAMPTQSSERRVYPRLPAPKGTIVAWHSFNKRVVSAVDNLGLGGLYIRTADPPATGTFIQLLLDAPAGEVRARAAVQRSNPKQGMGVKFVAMAQEDRARFARWLKALSS